MTETLKEIDRKMTELREKRSRLIEKTKTTKIKRLAKRFLDAKWTLNDQLELIVKDRKLAEDLFEMQESGEWDYDAALIELFGDDAPFTKLTSCDIESNYDAFGDERPTGSLTCHLGEDAQFATIRPTLEIIFPYFKNLRVNISDITWKMAEIEVEFKELRALLLSQNRKTKKK